MCNRKYEKYKADFISMKYAHYDLLLLFDLKAKKFRFQNTAHTLLNKVLIKVATISGNFDR